MRININIITHLSSILFLSCADAFTASSGRRFDFICRGGLGNDRKPAPSFHSLFDLHPSVMHVPSDLSLTSKSAMIFDTVTTTIGKSASTLVSVSVFVLLAYHRDAVVLTLWTGSILNAIVSKIAKKLLKHDRPVELQYSDSVKLKPSDGGMPSSHAMSLAFIGTSILGSIVPIEHRIVVGFAFAVYSTVALRYRVREHLHTMDQIAVGTVLGIINALAWLQFGIGGGDHAGFVLSYAREHWVSPETGLFPYSALAIPVAVGVVVVGSFERRIASWAKTKKRKK